MSKTIVNPNKLVRDMVSGKTVEEALSEGDATLVQQVEAKGVSNEIIEQFVGDCVMVYTVSFAFVGRLAMVKGNFLLLEDTSWLPDIGRPSETLKSLKFPEVEYLGTNMPINIQSIVYMVPLADIPKRTV
jgi:hypothetical protein